MKIPILLLSLLALPVLAGPSVQTSSTGSEPDPAQQEDPISRAKREEVDRDIRQEVARSKLQLVSGAYHGIEKPVLALTSFPCSAKKRGEVDTAFKTFDDAIAAAKATGPEGAEAEMLRKYEESRATVRKQVDALEKPFWYGDAKASQVDPFIEELYWGDQRMREVMDKLACGPVYDLGILYYKAKEIGRAHV